MILLSIILFPVLVWGMIYGGLYIFSPIEKAPTIKYGEFPFEITYMLKGETITVRDVYVCKYDGRYWTENGRYRKWKGYIKGTGEDHLVLLTTDNKQIYCTVGSAASYMGDLPWYVEPGKVTPELWCREIGGKENDTERLSDAEQDYYGIYLVSWTFSDPVENSFE